MSYEIKNRIWIEGNNGTYLAEGRVHLLKKIIETGSITQAAKTMKMSINILLKIKFSNLILSFLISC